ncbi:unnamed protein product [Spirodela intermedia]|uniref:T-complex protein 1 subunit delta n=1 Tax=Spirodela intermedia TaxID=51605 RepID=A0ABN7E9T9_SPIIN|nr:unnamed protein product [Spirodela intermedia]
MDKMIASASGEVITNDGATYSTRWRFSSPREDARGALPLPGRRAGDGTTTVVVLAGAFLAACQSLLSRGIHPTTISDAIHKSCAKAVDILQSMSVPLELSDRESLVKSAATSLNSKVVSQYSSLLAPLAVDSVLSVVDPARPDLVDLRDIKIVKKLGGLSMIQSLSRASIVVSDYTQMDRILRRNAIHPWDHQEDQATGCNVLLIQKSILRDAVTGSVATLPRQGEDPSDQGHLELLAIANVEHFREEKLGFADCVEEVSVGDGKIVKITGIKEMGKTTTVLVRGSNQLMIDGQREPPRRALCGQMLIELSRQLGAWSKELRGWKATVSRNLQNPSRPESVVIVTELRNRHARGDQPPESTSGRGRSQTSWRRTSFSLSCQHQCRHFGDRVRQMILKIDDIVTVR